MINAFDLLLGRRKCCRRSASGIEAAAVQIRTGRGSIGSGVGAAALAVGIVVPSLRHR